jgi:hypothetical protein
MNDLHERGRVMRLRETDVTIAVARFLSDLGGRVASIALPGGGSGIAFTPESEESSKNMGALIPDILVELPDGTWIAVESKPTLDLDDARKLASLVSGEYDSSIQRTLGCSSDALLTALAFGDSQKQYERVVEAKALTQIGMQVSPTGEIHAVWDAASVISRLREKS